MSTKPAAIGLLYPGDMGSSLARWIIAKGGHDVFTNLETPRRSERTHNLASAAGVKLLQTDLDIFRETDIVISVLRPDRAVEISSRIADAAKAVRDDGGIVRTKVFWDLNAISPDSMSKIVAIFNEKAPEITVLDGGIIGGPANLSSGYTPAVVYSGPDNATAIVKDVLAPIFTDKLQWVGDRIGQASALKLSYASFTKGFLAISFNALSLAQSHGVLPHLAEELAHSQPGFLRMIEGGLGPAAAKAFRFEGEMDEIANAMGTAGLKGGETLYNGVSKTYAAIKRTSIGQETIEEVRRNQRDWKEVASIVTKEIGEKL